jgi:tetratricopeptide (TPR) repeat protein
MVSGWLEAPPAPPPAPAPARPAAGLAPTAAPAPAAEPEPGAAGSGPAVAVEREAVALFRAGRVAEACERFQEAADQAPGEASRRNLASCHARLGRDAYLANRAAEAVQHYQRALEVSPAERGLWAALAVAQVKAGETGRAQETLQDALRRFPDDAEALYLLAEVQERQGRTREAVETLRRLLAAQPGHARGRTLLTALDREQRVEAHYWSQESAHFLVRYKGAGGIEVGRAVVDLLEQAYESIGQDLGVRPTERVQVGIYVTQTFAELAGVPPEYAEHILGFYDMRKLRLRLSASATHSTSLERLVRHEYAHLVIHQATRGRAPRWLHEGLAQVLEPRAAPRLVEIDVDLDRRAFTLAGLDRLFRSNAVGIAYQISHVVAESLVDRGGMTGMRAFLGRLGQGEALPQALRGAFDLGVEDLDARVATAAGRG